MRTGKLNISRGSQIAEGRAEEPNLTLVPPTARSPSDGEADGHQAFLKRLDALERLARLRSLDLLSADEFAAGKKLLLSHSAEQESAVPSEKPLGPSLVARMFSWKFLPIGLVAGLALSFGAQPQETVRFVDQALRMFGA